MDKQAILSRVDHTELNPAATWEDIRTLIDDAITYGTATVCIPPCYVKRAVSYVEGKLPICTVIGFPHGNSPTAAKAAETKCVVEAGAAEVDMVINRGWVKDGLFDAVTDEIRIVKAACGDKLLKVIIECCGLTDEEKIALCKSVTDAGADRIGASALVKLMKAEG